MNTTQTQHAEAPLTKRPHDTQRKTGCTAFHHSITLNHFLQVVQTNFEVEDLTKLHLEKLLLILEPRHFSYTSCSHPLFFPSLQLGVSLKIS